MNISSSTASYASQASSSQTRPQNHSILGPPPKGGGKERLSSALETIGVDDSTAASVLNQIDEAIAVLESESSSGSSSHSQIRTTIEGVLEANGIDAGAVEEAIQAAGVSGPGGPSGSGEPSRLGRPDGPPPPPRENETGSVESALLSAGVDASSTDELISQIIGTIQDLTSESSGTVSEDELRSTFASLLEENGVNVNAFEQAIGDQLGSEGSFLDFIA